MPNFLKPLITSLTLLFLLAQTPSAETIRTEDGHFYVHYSSSARETAKEVALTAQEVYFQLVTAYDLHEKLQPIHILVTDNLDVGNGFADYYQNHVTIWATNLDYELRGTHRWIRNVVTHELGHIFSLKVAAKYPFRYGLIQTSILNQKQIDIGLNIPFYSLVTPSWWVEGIAQFEADFASYDARDTNREMLLRMATLEEDLLSFSEMGVFTHDWLHQEMVYNQGYALSKYIADNYGVDAVRNLASTTGYFSFKRAIRKSLGISASDLDAAWRQSLLTQYREFAASRGTVFEGELLIDAGTFDVRPTLSPDGARIAYVSNKGEEVRLARLLIRDLSSGRDTQIEGVGQGVYGNLDWSDDGAKIVYTKFGRGTLFLDLYVYDVETKSSRRITSQLRAKDPAFTPDGQWIVFVQNEDGANRLGMIKSDGSELRWLTNNKRWPDSSKKSHSARINNFVQIYGPDVSPDGKRVAFSIFNGQDRDIAIMGTGGPYFSLDSTLADSTAFPDSVAYPDSVNWKLILHSSSNELDPAWLPDGSGLVYSSDRNGVYDLYHTALDSGNINRISNVLGGAFAPTVSADGKTVVYMGYHAGNFNIYGIDLPGVGEGVTDVVMVERDYQTLEKQRSAAQLFDVGPTRNPGFSLVGWAPYIRFGPQFVGDEFSVNQIGGGIEAAISDALGSRLIYGAVQVTKNIKEEDKPSTNFYLVAQKRFGNILTTSRSLAPSVYAYGGRAAINDVRDRYLGRFTFDPVLFPVTAVTFLGDENPTPVNSSLSRIRTDFYQVDKTDYTYLFGGVGIGTSIGRRHRLGLDLSLRKYSLSNAFDIEQKNVSEIIECASCTENVAAQVAWGEGFPYNLRSSIQENISLWDIDYFRGPSMTISWSYGRGTPTVDGLINPQKGRYISLAYRYWGVTVVDSLTFDNPDTDFDLFPDDPTLPVWKPVAHQIRMNELIASWREFIRNPIFRNHTLALSAVVGYKDNSLPNPENPGMENALDGWAYWPLRYRLGGLGTLRAYPYFTLEGSKMAFGRANYVMPLKRALGHQLGFIYLDKVYISAFVEGGLMWNRDDGYVHQITPDDFVAKYPLYAQDTQTRRWDFQPHKLGPKDIIADVGAELRILTWTFYRLPMTAYAVWARRLSDVPYPYANSLRHRWVDPSGAEVAVAFGAAPPADAKWMPVQPLRDRLYFGLTFGGFGSAGNRGSSSPIMRPDIPVATTGWWEANGQGASAIGDPTGIIGQTPNLPFLRGTDPALFNSR